MNEEVVGGNLAEAKRCLPRSLPGDLGGAYELEGAVITYQAEGKEH